LNPDSETQLPRDFLYLPLIHLGTVLGDHGVRGALHPRAQQQLRDLITGARAQRARRKAFFAEGRIERLLYRTPSI